MFLNEKIIVKTTKEKKNNNNPVNNFFSYSCENLLWKMGKPVDSSEQINKQIKKLIKSYTKVAAF